MKHLTDEQIWDIIDGNASLELAQRHTELLKTDTAYCQHFESFESLHGMLLMMPLESPSMRFEQNIMERLPKAPVKRAAHRFPLMFVFGLSSLVLWIWLSIPKNAILPALPTVSFFQSINTEGVTSLFANPMFFNAFVMLNILFLYVILDKGVFKPYFDKRLK